MRATVGLLAALLGATAFGAEDSPVTPGQADVAAIPSEPPAPTAAPVVAPVEPSPAPAASTSAVSAPAGATPLPADIPALDGRPVKVEKRILVKTAHPFFTGGVTFFERGDYYNNPGLSFASQMYLNESLGISAKFSLILSTLNSAANEVFRISGLVPDSERVIAVASVGGRYSLGYGKVALMPGLSQVVHFEVQAIGHFGFTLTDRAANPTLMVGPSLLVRINDLLYAHADLELTLGMEQRTAGPIVLGFLPQVFFGVRL